MGGIGRPLPLHPFSASGDGDIGGRAGLRPATPLERRECTWSRMEVIANAIIFFSGASNKTPFYGFCECDS